MPQVDKVSEVYTPKKQSFQKNDSYEREYTITRSYYREKGKQTNKTNQHISAPPFLLYMNRKPNTTLYGNTYTPVAIFF